MERSVTIATIIGIAILFFCSGIALSGETWHHDKEKKYILCGYAYGYTDPSPPSEILNQTELVNNCERAIH
jgi:hypothetical protein